ncbi:MAG: DUF3267 domain-containing protein [Oscillospiraceae bacterium]
MPAKDLLQLPEGYTGAFRVDLRKDRKLFWLINGLAVLIALALLWLGAARHPISALLQSMLRHLDEGDYLAYAAPLLCILLGALVYMVLHELTHGVFMRGFSGVRPKYGFTGAYAYAGSEVYFCKVHYLVIALAPVVLLGVVIAVLTALLPEAWFWPVYFLQVVNLSGAAGDFYVTARFLRLPADILVQDTGTAMTVFLRES